MYSTGALLKLHEQVECVPGGRETVGSDAAVVKGNGAL